MKRFSEGGGGGYGGHGQGGQGRYQQEGNASFKRFRGGPNDLEIRLLIPSRVAGSVIGKGGQNIARLRSDFKASVTVPDCPGPERILTIFAELENGLKVVEEVLPALDEVAQMKFNRGGRGGRGGDDGYDNNGGGGRDEYDIRLIVHQSQAGCVIGKGGSKIKELRDKTGARIKIFSNCCPQSTDRVAQLFGSGETVVNCIREIIELLKTAPVKGPEQPYDPHNYDEYYADEYGGYGGAGQGAPPGRESGGARGGGRFGGGAPGGRGGFGGSRGSGGGRFNADGGYGDGGGYGGAPSGGYNSTFYDRSPAGAGGGGFGAPGELTGPGMGGGPGARNSNQVTIPKDMAGAIIGKSGQRIRKIRADSGAGITIDEPLPGSLDRIITITGNPEQIHVAQYLLQQSVREYGSA